MEQLFKRDGSIFTGTVNTDEKGRTTYTQVIPCDRCHVIDGQRLWVMGMENNRPYSRTGFECWTCGNTGIRGQRERAPLHRCEAGAGQQDRGYPRRPQSRGRPDRPGAGRSRPRGQGCRLPRPERRFHRQARVAGTGTSGVCFVMTSCAAL